MEQRLRPLILELTARRGHGKSICPSEVARVTGEDDWRRLMPEVRRLADRLALEGRIVILQRGRQVGADARGPIRLRQS